jgi:hypothetical protein
MNLAGNFLQRDSPSGNFQMGSKRPLGCGIYRQIRMTAKRELDV